MSKLTLSTPLSDILRTTKDHLDALREMGISTVEQLLLYLPRAYEDLTTVQTLTSTPLDTKVTVRGVVSSLKLIRTRNRKVLVQALFTDQEGAIAHITWFNQPHIMRMIKDGDDVALTGKITESGYKLQMSSPQFELAGRRPLVHSGRLVPMYPSHSLISTKWLREKMVLLKDTIDLLPETLPAEILKEENLLDRCSTIRVLHFPEDPKEVDRALDRLAFEEMFHVQRDALERKREMKKHTSDRIKIPMDVEMIRKFFTSLKFTPTGSQKIAIYEILKDMELSEPMSRLLEGDVGSGKTLVATAVMANVLRHGGQCALMVPTEVLARQHSESIGKTLINFHTFIQKTKKTRLPSIALLTGSTPLSESQSIKRGIASDRRDRAIQRSQAGHCRRTASLRGCTETASCGEGKSAFSRHDGNTHSQDARAHGLRPSRSFRSSGKAGKS
ncbi:MAG: ATP-dependent DNA helicase RecG [Candidatus Peregrinibacteria bacterium Greene1014_49]|nr:MAG: ATP-dependent DNA helicase RecG [Candidatus Peregrinibacteria bacterium Greene1014_49]